MMQKQHTFSLVIALLISCGHISHIQSMESQANSDYKQTPMRTRLQSRLLHETEKNTATSKKRKKHTHTIESEKLDELEWKTYINENGKRFAEANLPLILCRDRENIFTKPEQQAFLKKFKKANLPYSINNEEKKVFNSLQFGSFFVVTKTDTGWEISPCAAIPTKPIND